MSLTDEQIGLARDMRRFDRNWKSIAAQLGCSIYAIRRVLDPVFVECNRERKRKYRRKHPKPTVAQIRGQYRTEHRVENHMGERNPFYDPHRDGPLPEPMSLTAAFCGDPLPGRSALDKLRQGA